MVFKGHEIGSRDHPFINPEISSMKMSNILRLGDLENGFFSFEFSGGVVSNLLL